MKKVTFWIFSIIALTLILIGAERTVTMRQKAEAVRQTVYRQRWALLIGINQYPNLPPRLQLHYAVADVNDLKRVLIDQYQFPESNVVTLIDAQATKKGITRALADLASKRRIAKDDAVLIFFSGHGQTVSLQNGGEMGYMLPYDAEVDLADPTDFSAYYATCIGMDELQRLSPGIPAKHVLFLIDACYSGLAATSRGGLSSEIPNYLAKVASLNVRQIITAGLKGEESLEKPEWGHGAFTYKLLEALETGVADFNSDGILTARELGVHLRNVVPNIANQTPQPAYFGGEGEFLFIPTDPQEPIKLEGVKLDTTPPQIRLTYPVVRNGGEIRLELPQSGEIILEGTITDDGRVADVTLAGQRVVLRGNRWFSIPLRVKAGRKYDLHFRATDSAKNNADYRFTIVIPEPLIDKRGEMPPQGTTVGENRAEMVWIEGGTFEMGSNDGGSGEKPIHTVTVSGFDMDVHEVTNAQYRKFIQATGHAEPRYFNNSKYNQPNHPVVGVSWRDAMAYAIWAGKRLPTEAEWEYAARGGLKGKKYAWGDEAPDAGGTYRANYDPGNYSEDGYRYTAPVKSYPPNGYGLYDMAGNVYEWCLDEYAPDFYKNSPSLNPVAGGQTPDGTINQYKNSGAERMLRGGSWYDNNNNVRVANRFRNRPDNRNYGNGFRCVSAR